MPASYTLGACPSTTWRLKEGVRRSFGNQEFETQLGHFVHAAVTAHTAACSHLQQGLSDRKGLGWTTAVHLFQLLIIIWLVTIRLQKASKERNVLMVDCRLQQHIRCHKLTLNWPLTAIEILMKMWILFCNILREAGVALNLLTAAAFSFLLVDGFIQQTLLVWPKEICVLTCWWINVLLQIRAFGTSGLWVSTRQIFSRNAHFDVEKNARIRIVQYYFAHLRRLTSHSKPQAASDFNSKDLWGHSCNFKISESE